VNDCIFSLTEADMHQGPGKPPANAERTVKKAFRVLIVKPLTEVADAGYVLKSVLEKYEIREPSKQVIVAFNDTSLLVGTVTIQHGSDTRGADQHRGTKNIFQVVGKDFVRLRMGIGRSSQISDEQFVLESFSEQNNEIDLFGHTLDVTGQAFQHYIAFGDIKATKKKFASKKLPKQLRKVCLIDIVTGIVIPSRTYPRRSRQCDRRGANTIKKCNEHTLASDM
jgi:peptidyl-tRNA hydrolase